ncbi:MAG TPA: cell division topological specificity factor MinE [Firmicutes bacterium]|nr:cell division topological specificity factor MinE [Bacillota bacterium]
MGFWDRLFGKETPSKEIAKERLRLVLIHDRAAVSPSLMEALRDEIITVVNKYIEVDERSMTVDLKTVDSSVALVASIPVRNVRRGRLA